MSLQGLPLLVGTLLLGFTSCNNNNQNVDAVTSGWQFPSARGPPKSKIGRQMPPHPEPDAVLINVGGKGQPRIPEGGFPGLPGGPGIFGAPRDPNIFGFPSPGGGPGINSGPGVFGIPQGPDVFGIPQGPGVFGIPQGPGMFGIPQGPGMFGIPQGPGIPVIPQQPGVPVIPQGPGISGIPQEPTVFGLPGIPDTFGVPGFHIIPNNPAESGMYGPLGVSSETDMFVSRFIPTSRGPRSNKNRPMFTLRTGVFVMPDGSLQPSELEMFGQRGVFAVAGSGNIPFPGAPNFFYPGRGPNAPTPGRFPQTFVPPPEGIFPGVFYAKSPAIPNPPRGNPDANLPSWEGDGGREINDEPNADSFPLTDAV